MAAKNSCGLKIEVIWPSFTVGVGVCGRLKGSLVWCGGANWVGVSIATISELATKVSLRKC